MAKVHLSPVFWGHQIETTQNGTKAIAQALGCPETCSDGRYAQIRSLSWCDIQLKCGVSCGKTTSRKSWACSDIEAYQSFSLRELFLIDLKRSLLRLSLWGVADSAAASRQT